MDADERLNTSITKQDLRNMLANSKYNWFSGKMLGNYPYYKQRLFFT